MAKSIITDDMEYCYFCGMPKDDIHHVIYGSGRRIEVSDRNGFIVPLCKRCHTMSDEAVHFDHVKDVLLKRICQLYYEKDHTREEWLRLVGRNYL